MFCHWMAGSGWTTALTHGDVTTSGILQSSIGVSPIIKNALCPWGDNSSCLYSNRANYFMSTWSHCCIQCKSRDLGKILGCLFRTEKSYYHIYLTRFCRQAVLTCGLVHGSTASPCPDRTWWCQRWSMLLLLLLALSAACLSTEFRQIYDMPLFYPTLEHCYLNYKLNHHSKKNSRNSNGIWGWSNKVRTAKNTITEIYSISTHIVRINPKVLIRWNQKSENVYSMILQQQTWSWHNVTFYYIEM